MPVIGIVAKPKKGKAQPYGSIVYTPYGPTTIESLRVGDLVLGEDGKTYPVSGVFDKGELNTYRVEFSDGVVTFCCKDHLWKVIEPKNRRPSSKGYGTTIVVNTNFLIKEYKTINKQKNQRPYIIPLCTSVEFFRFSELEVHPYVLGALIGDGGLTGGTPRFSTVDSHNLDMISYYSNKLFKLGAYDGNNTYYLSRCKDTDVNLLAKSIIKLGLNVTSELKFIPREYKYTTYYNRQALLSGLMDTDGYICKRNKSTYTTISKQLAIDVMWLVQSLGGVASIKQKHKKYTYKGDKKCGKTSYDVRVTLPFNPFTLKRKADRWSVPRQLARTIKSITPYIKLPCRCIEVDSKDHTYLTNDFIVTHNTVSACTFPKPMLLIDIMDRGFESVKNTKNPDGTLVVPDWEQITLIELYHEDRTRMTFKSFASTNDARKTSGSTPDYAKGAITIMDKYEAIMDELFQKGTVSVGGKWDENEKIFLGGSEAGPFKTLIIDPLTNMFRLWKSAIMDINNVGDIRRGDYIALDAILSNQFIPNLKSLSDKIPFIILTDHEDADLSEKGDLLSEYPVGPSKNLGKNLSEFMDNVWRVDTDVVSQGGSNVKKYIWRTKEHGLFRGAGSRWDLPEKIIPATYAALEKVLSERKK